MNSSLPGMVLYVFAGYVVIFSFAIFYAVKGFVTGGHHVVHPGSRFIAGGFHLGYTFSTPTASHVSKGPSSQPKPAHTASSILVKLVGNFGYAVAGILKQAVEGIAVKVSGFVFAGEQYFEAVLQTINGFGGFERGEFCFGLEFALERLEVEREDFRFAFGVLRFFIKALAGFIAQPFIFFKLRYYVGQLKHIAAFVVGQGGVQVVGYFYECVEPYQV